MQSVLISVRPQWCELIASGKKTIEVRKNRPKLETPFKAYIYQTQNGKVGTGLFTSNGEIMGRSVKNGKVIGEFVCDNVTNLFADSRFWLDEKAVEQTCLTGNQIREYANGREALYGWHISALQIYDKPRELSELTKFGYDAQMPCCRLTRPPQSWGYVEDAE